ncbi:hypothetical protein JR316_0004949 [Psilocybe cubensis]|uniref:Uncharacterized protein n=1 Tax=Psilocybe cubensis TaxID=181762 RepID=A0ACB8H545_PSICU|nr:hypothetical protein JR316_0004949 [Psilocybe cubensis]KAH9482849.1 hypothetical protein JR316_0004949 [Psilocybe cubensis]
MNPHSSHPPRTPRTSMHASSSNNYSASIYETKEEIEEKVDPEDFEVDLEEERVQEAEKRITKEEVWREMFVTSNGRDKAFILAQQSVPFSAEVSTEKAKKVQKPFLHTILYAPPPVLLELANAAADDVATWSRLGLLGKKIGSRAEDFSNWCWLLSTLVGLVENGVERQMINSLEAEVEGRLYKESMTGATAKSKPKSTKLDEKELARLRKQDYWLQVTRAKLLMDLIFVSYDVFNLRRGRDTIKAFAGLTAAILSSAKLYDRHKNALLKTLLTSTS